MDILTTAGWEDYSLVDSGFGKRLERFGQYILSRPDPGALWQPKLNPSTWQQVHAEFTNHWITKTSLPQKWQMCYKNIQFQVRLTPFKHVGVFPEQAAHWEWLTDKSQGVNVLNLFGYTGIATLVCARAGASVTHVDGSRPSLAWAKENSLLSGLSDKPVRWLLEDVLKFCKREVRRGNHYDAIIMDPPVFGHGPKGETWKFTESLPQLLSLCRQLLSPSPAFVLINAYAVSTSAITLHNLLSDLTIGLSGKIQSGELALQESTGKRLLSTGIYGRWYLPTPNLSG